MNIAVFHNLPPGGAKRVLYEQVKGLSKNNSLDLYILSADNEPFLDVRPFCKNVYLSDFHINSSDRFKRISEDLQIMMRLKEVHKKIAKVINSRNYDVVLAHPDMYTQSPFLLRYLKVPSVYYCHEWLRIVYEKEFRFHSDNPFHIFYEMVSRRVKKSIDLKNIQNATKVLVNSKYTQKNIEKAYKIRSIVVYPAVDVTVFKQQRVKKQKKALFIGEPVSENGYDLVENAFLTENTDIQLEVLPFTDIKKVSDSMLARKYAQSMVTLSLSYNEPFGLSPLESIACGTPVIALNEGGYLETIDQRFGILIKRDSNDLLSAIKKINTKTSETKEKGNRYVKDNWSWGKHCQKLEEELKIT